MRTFINHTAHQLTTPFADLYTVWSKRLDDAKHWMRRCTGHKGDAAIDCARAELVEAKNAYEACRRVVDALEHEGEMFYHGSLDDQAAAAIATDNAIEDARHALGESDPRTTDTRHGWALLALALGYTAEDAAVIEAEMRAAYDAADAVDEDTDTDAFEAEDALDAADVAIDPATRFDKTFELDEMPAAAPGHLPRIEQERRLRVALKALDDSMTKAGLLLAVWTMEGRYITGFGLIDHETVERLRTIAERAARRAAWACLRINSHPDLYDGDVWMTVADALAERPLLRGRAFASVAALRACPQVAHADDPRILALALA